MRPGLLVAAPVSSPVSVQIALALEEQGLLGGYHSATALQDRGLAGTLAAVTGRRGTRGLPAAKVSGFQWTTAFHTIRPVQIATLYSNAARRVSSFEGVLGFRGALPAFEAAHRQGKPCIYAVGGLDLAFVGGVEAEERQRHPGLPVPATATPQRIAAVRRELDLADLLIFNSPLCRDSHHLTPAQLARAKVIPLAFPPPRKARSTREGTPLRVLWAGAFSPMKGAHYLTDALRRLGSGANLEVTVFGRCSVPDQIVAGLHRIRFHKPIPHARLMDEYARHDVLVLPTLHDSFGMVISEAMSQGTPVITTDRAGAITFIRPGENGLVIPAADGGALADALAWAMAQREALAAMGQAARATAAAWQWADYRAAVAAAIGELAANHHG